MLGFVNSSVVRGVLFGIQKGWNIRLMPAFQSEVVEELAYLFRRDLEVKKEVGRYTVDFAKLA